MIPSPAPTPTGKLWNELKGSLESEKSGAILNVVSDLALCNAVSFEIIEDNPELLG